MLQRASDAPILPSRTLAIEGIQRLDVMTGIASPESLHGKPITLCNKLTSFRGDFLPTANYPNRTIRLTLTPGRAVDPVWAGDPLHLLAARRTVRAVDLCPQPSPMVVLLLRLAPALHAP